MPKPVVTRLYTDIKAALAIREVQDALAAQGMTAIGSTPEAAAQFFQSELTKYARQVKQSGATSD